MGKTQAVRGETPADRMGRYVRRWLKGEAGIRTLMNVAADLRLQRVHPSSDTRRIDGFVGMLVSWSTLSQRPSKPSDDVRKPHRKRSRHPWKDGLNSRES